MAKVIITQDYLEDIADAIREKTGLSDTYKPSEMAPAIMTISGGGGIVPSGTTSITSNGTYNVSTYAVADVDVENSYVASDQGKVVSNGALVNQSAATYMQNNTYDTTLVNSVTVDVSGGGSSSPTLQTKTKTYTPTTSQQTETVTADNGYDGLDEVSITVNAMPTGTAGTPTATKGTVSGNSISITPSVTNSAGYITGGTKTGTAVSVSASELVSGTYSITGTGNSNVTNYAYASVSAGSAGTPTATKGSVSNHSISVTPSVTNTTGWITGSTKTGTAVSVSASELVSGSTTLTENNTYDVTNLAEVVVSVEGGGGEGGSGPTVASATKTLSAAASSISFTGLSGNPTSFVITSSADQTTGGTKVVAVAYDGSSLYGMDITTQMADDTGFSKSYSSGTLTVTASSANFQANTYKLVYTYGGSSSDVKTEDVQVGSGATSITFTGLSGEPSYFSCVFKSDFSTSSGYQRVIDVVFDGSSVYGNAMDSSAKALTSWTKSYSNGSLTITSTGTNNGGYFHQPGYYQLTYVTGGSSDVLNLQTKTATPTSSASTITADSGYDGLEKVIVEGVVCSNLSASNIKSGVVVNIGTATDSDSIASVTGTYSAGGSSKNAQTAQSTDRATTSTYTEVVSLTCSSAGTYHVYWSTFRSSTSGTWGSQLYINDNAYSTASTGSWSNHIQNMHLSNVVLSANDEVAVRVRTRGNNYYGYVGTLTIIQA